LDHCRLIYTRVRVLLSGGLGNQMFMYAAARALAVRNRCALVLDLQRFGRERVYQRRYLLDGLPIHGAAFCPGPWTLLCDAADRMAYRSRLPVIGRRPNRIYEATAANATSLDSRLFSELHRHGAVLDGYWQSEGYFADAADLVRHELTPTTAVPPSLARDEAAIREANQPVAVGIRFYCEVAGWNENASRVIGVFREALAAVSKRLPASTFFVFTDSPSLLADPACLGVPFRLAGGMACDDEAIGVLSLMRRCQSFLVGYSSFHWWAAWLGSHSTKQVFCLPELGGNPHLYFPRSWIRVLAGD
jgi:hypothetical protein